MARIKTRTVTKPDGSTAKVIIGSKADKKYTPPATAPSPTTTLPPAARGDEFAPNFNEELKKRGTTLDEAVKKYGGIGGALDSFAGESRSSRASTPISIFPSKKPAVLSSKAARKDLQDNIKPGFEEARAGIEEQKALLEQQKALEAQMATNRDTNALDTQTRQAKLEEIKNKALLIQKELSATNDQEDTATTTTPTPEAPAEPEDPYAIYGEAGTKQKEFDRATEDYYKKAEAVSKSILDIQNGVVPFSKGEKAQIQSLEQEFKALIQEQGMINKSAVGTANIRGYQTGAAEYDPNFTTKIIGEIATAGVQKIATLNTKMAGAVAELEQSFRDNKIASVKDAYQVYKDAAKERQDALKESIDDIQAEMKAARDAMQKNKEEINKVVLALRKNGAPSEVVMEAMSASSPDEALFAAGDYLEEGSGVVGEYLYAKRNGYTGSFSQYSNEDANRKRTVVNVSTSDKKQAAIGSFASAFVPGAQLPDGTPVLDVNGYITPDAWKMAITEAPSLGIDRKEFIETYGSQLWGGEDGFVPSSYGLTPVEQKLIKGELPE